MEEDIKELLKRKDDYDFAYGTQIHRPYVMNEKDWELIENLLTRYKEIERKNKELEKDNFKLKNELETKRKEYQETYKDIREELYEQRAMLNVLNDILEEE